jgi:uncharacterized protein (TIGR04255 family)
MNDSPHFEPIFPSHAIERCAAMVIFEQQLPAKALQKVVDQAQSSFRNAGLETVSGANIGMQLDFVTGRATPLPPGAGPTIFTSRDRATNFIIAPNALTVQTGRYVRWQPFAGQFEELMLPFVQAYADIVSITSLQLEYLDRFIWTGDWGNLQLEHLLRPDSGFVVERAALSHGQWHSHSGWFDGEGAKRRLVNVNIDLVEFVPPRGPPLAAPSVGITTLIREMPGPVSDQPTQYIEATSVQGDLEQLHFDLKTLLGEIIMPSLAQRIGLTAQD